jgi:hypothetical protein
MGTEQNEEVVDHTKFSVMALDRHLEEQNCPSPLNQILAALSRQPV